MTSRPLRTLFLLTGGALYASSVLALLIAYLSGSDSRCPALDVVVGIRSCLIFLQIQFHLTTNAWAMSTTRNEHLSTNFCSRKRRENEGGREDQTFAYLMQPMAVHVTVEQGNEQNRSSREHKLSGYEGPAASSKTTMDTSP